ncbi:MAG: hypothetical protein WC594_14055, partial [Thermodesulfovibrionales bacterium]
VTLAYKGFAPSGLVLKHSFKELLLYLPFKAHTAPTPNAGFGGLRKSDLFSMFILADRFQLLKPALGIAANRYSQC